MKYKKQMSDSYCVGAILAVAGGFLDAYTYLCRGGVFANAQTGNIVLFGIRLAEKDLAGALYYVVPIVSFFAGILVAEIVKNRFGANKGMHWRQITLGIEFLTLLVVAFLPAGTWDMLANVMVSFACSLQVESFRKMNGNPYATTMCTGNLRSATEQLYHYKMSRNRKALASSLQYYGIIVFFVFGAVLGSVFSERFQTRSVLFGCAGLLAAWLLMFIGRQEDVLCEE